ncbi:Hypothetical predicted protein [Mytilus galloprovincialis]|uniref:WSC domain-containing protein n=1 Tax=Mytilus galloprovincialis TaxID=29158 RepID=A0A8B6CY26_MYTGA|nr:Hypothetical predicted protein [Mytilus galloprovincialis]
MFSDCEQVYQCYKIHYNNWVRLKTDGAVTNIWCEHYCKDAGANHQYSGTISNRCYCRSNKPHSINNKQHYKCTDTLVCKGNTGEFCGGCSGQSEWITVSKIDRTTKIVTLKNTQVSIRSSTTSVFMGMITSDTYPEIATPNTLSSTTSGNVNTAILTVTNEMQTKGLSAKTNTTSVSLKRSTTSYFMNMITSDTYPATVMQIIPDTLKKFTSKTNKTVNSSILTVMSEASTQTTTGKRPKTLLCRCPNKFCINKWQFLDGLDITDSEIMKIVLEDFYQNILSEITIDKKFGTKEVRKRNSAINKTIYAKFIGWGSIVFLILPVVLLIVLDLLNCCVNLQKRSRCSRHCKRNRIKEIPDSKYYGDSVMPLQEKVPSTEDYFASRCGNNFHPDEMKRETYRRRREDPC